MIRQQLGLNLGTDAELAIHSLMQTGLLEHLIVFDRNTGEIRHELHIATVRITPDQRARRVEHIETPTLATSGHQ
ncbi:MAG: Uncharacterised protein [Cyanobium sp. ARS6]|nr:MAG: Uncharacterised protein [Cyanobium sp. ARS6]